MLQRILAYFSKPTRAELKAEIALLQLNRQRLLEINAAGVIRRTRLVKEIADLRAGRPPQL